MTPGELCRHLREWRNEQEALNYRAGLVATCVIAAAPGKKGRKIPKPLEWFGGAKRAKRIQPVADISAIRAWAEEENKAHR